VTNVSRGGSSVRRLLIGYALATDHPDRVVRVALGEAPLPGISPPTPLILPDQVVDSLYRIPFNQAPDEMVATLSDFLAPYREPSQYPALGWRYVRVFTTRGRDIRGLGRASAT
jgi:pimeloyl-ACP methyl ester carboxylesterase